MPLSAIVDWPTMNLLLDTNVLIDYLGRKEPFFANAERIVAHSPEGSSRGQVMKAQ